jgi:hypothetical protein
VFVTDTGDPNYGQSLKDGHVYRFQFIVHDGDQNKAGGDCGEGCATGRVSVSALGPRLVMMPKGQPASPMAVEDRGLNRLAVLLRSMADQMSRFLLNL